MTPITALEHIMYPENFVKNFPDMDAFKEWLKDGSIKDLIETRKAFEKANMFDYCPHIQSEIDFKVDKMLEGFGIDCD